jgi:Flp pilus assembly protein TadD
MSSIGESLAAALAHHQAGRLQAAEALYRTILAAEPGHTEALHFLGVIAYQTGKLADAAELLARAIGANPGVAAYHHHLGLVNSAAGRLDEAVASFNTALRLAPDLAEAHSGLGNVLKDLGRLEEAISRYRRALEAKPDFADAYSNLGNVLELLGRHAESASAYEAALRFRPDHAEAHWNHSLLLLLLGDFERGWAEYEWRWQTKGFARRNYPQPRWRGERAPGRTILLHAEQGLGDTIQFARYASIVKAYVGKVVFECQRPLLRLLSGCTGIDVLIAEGDEPPAFDLYAPLLSVPGILETNLARIPSATGYVVPDPDRVAHWRRRLAGLEGYRVGIGWQGNAKYAKDRYRSIPLAQFAPLAQVPGVRLVSLQKGAGEEQLEAFRSRLPILDFSAELDEASGPFVDTAAILESLDLVITSDSALAHLAGAVGVPVWVALPSAPDWRWLLGRDDSPWYPGMRLFRQKTLGDWAGVFQDIAQALRGRHRPDNEFSSSSVLPL